MFCSGEVTAGRYHDEDEQLVHHSEPVCAAFAHSDCFEDFVMLSRLKAESDAGIRQCN